MNKQSDKVRFGVSIQRDLAEQLTMLAKALGTDRSTLVNEALREFLHDRVHVLRPHACEGVLVVIYGPEISGEVSRVLERFEGIIVARTHIHDSERKCVEIIYLRGPSQKIISLERMLRDTKVYTTRYIANKKKSS
ncbi:MAG: CopG family transcriptional regulator [Thermoprotei archaeon]|nr:MAG: CopG family transcriptional regulator [Thermoprotei archaeon]